MFDSMKRTLSRKTANTQINEYGESVTKYYIVADKITMFISLQNEQTSNSNDMRIKQCSHIGITTDNVSIGDIIDDKYIVEFINAAGAEKIVYMKEAESNGYFS